MNNGEKENPEISKEKVVEKQDKNDSMENKSPRKTWNVPKETLEDIRSSANKYAVLSKYDEESVQENTFNEEDMINKYLTYKRKPPNETYSKWTQELKAKFDQKWEEMWNESEEIDEEVLEADSEMAKSMEMNEIGGKGGDIMFFNSTS